MPGDEEQKQQNEQDDYNPLGEDKRRWTFGKPPPFQMEDILQRYPRIRHHLQEKMNKRENLASKRNEKGVTPLVPEEIKYEPPAYNVELSFAQLEEKKKTLLAILYTKTFFKSICIRHRFGPLEACQEDTFVKKGLASGCEKETSYFLHESRDNETNCSKTLFQIAQKSCSEQYSSFVNCLHQKDGLYSGCTESMTALENCLRPKIPSPSLKDLHDASIVDTPRE